MAHLLYAVGTKSQIDFGTNVFYQTLKHGESFVVKMPIAFPYLLTELIISQHPTIIRDNEEEFPKSHPLSFDYRFFVEAHVKDIEVQSAKDSGHPATMIEPIKENILS